MSSGESTTSRGSSTTSTSSTSRYEFCDLEKKVGDFGTGLAEEGWQEEGDGGECFERQAWQEVAKEEELVWHSEHSL